MGPMPDAGPLGGAGKTVEADETELAKSRKTKRPVGHKRRDNIVVMSLVERDGAIRSMTLDYPAMSIIYKHVHTDSRLVTNKAAHYKFPPVTKHESVDHSKFEWVRGDVHTNTLEGFFSIFKRGLIGVYQHVNARHLDRYLAEFDFRQNTRAKLGIDDIQREAIAVQAAKGKRLTYQTTPEAQAAEDARTAAIGATF
jgi:ISXO2-like transposase domain